MIFDPHWLCSFLSTHDLTFSHSGYVYMAGGWYFILSPIKRCSIYFDDVWNIIHLFFSGCLFNHTMFKRRETETRTNHSFVWLLSIIRKLWLADTFSRQLWPFYRLWSSSSSAFRFDQFFSWFFWKTIPSTITSSHTRNHINSLIDDIQWKND